MESKQEKLLNKRNAELEKQLAQKNRDLEIEASLERVRARTMAMQRSEELAETVFILFQQFKELGENPDQATIGIINEEEHVIEYWVTMYGSQTNKVFKFSIDEPNVTHKIYKAWKAKETSLVIDLSGKALLDFAIYRQSKGGARLNKGEKRRVINVAFFSKGLINVQSTETRSEESIRLLERFAGVFDQTYTRFLDLQKAEEQAREAKIEVALERVRARAMSMHQSQDINAAVLVVFEELEKLDLKILRCGIGIIDKANKVGDIWTTVKLDGKSSVQISGKEPMNIHPLMQGTYDAWLDQTDFLYNLEGDDLMKYYRAVSGTNFTLPESQSLTDENDGAKQYYYTPTFKTGNLYAFRESPFPDDAKSIMKRFASVLNLTFSRFLDLQKAEAQAREAQIEAALEKVRSRSLAMHQTDELREVVSVLFEKLHDLGIVMAEEAASIVIFTEGTNDLILWNAIPDQLYSKSFHIPYYDTTVITSLFGAKKNGIDFFTKNYTPAEKDHFWKWAVQYSDYKYIPDERKKHILAAPYFACSVAFTKNSAIMVSSYLGKLLSEKEGEILKRFARVFEQAYVRFLDLQKAEAQAREAQIELSLERVRAKTMAMHTSEHVGETVATMFDELVKLGIENTARCGISIIDDNQEMEVWRASYDPDGKVDMVIGRLDMTIHPLLQGVFKAWENKETAYAYELSGKDLKNYYREINNSPNFPAQFEIGSLPAKQFHNTFFFPEGAIFTFTLEPLSADEVKLFKRFAGVFGLTYRRFLDLQKAEEQAKESQIQLALERVRARTMAMQKSEELHEVIQLVYEQLLQLNFKLDNANFVLNYKESDDFDLWVAVPGARYATKIHIPYFDHPNFNNFNNAKEKGGLLTDTLRFEEKNSFFKHFFEHAPYVPEERKAAIFNTPGYARSTVFMKNVALSILNYRGIPFSEDENATLMRFGQVFDQTYTRFNDLQKAEAQAREAIKQASVDRVRGEIASMRSTNDLERITPLIWNELTILRIPFIRCGVFIVDEGEQLIHTHLSTADGKALATFDLTFESDGIGRDVLPAWRNKLIATVHWSEEEFATYTKNLVDQGTVASSERYVTEHPDTSLDLHFFPFLQGMLYVGNVVPLTDDEKDLVQSLADAFSTAYARYEDFNKLEAAKQQVENTLTDLKATQTKLIQSEKMASLGELTAGIAHEIQNPLNFVNNFSEVNQEMIEELEEELKAGNIAEAMAIAADIKGNEQKINHHGKRADGIVKGMLAHSRTGGGDKQPTDISALADEFLRLSYHGLRAKDKTFNAELITHFDEGLLKANVIPQDIGRVMLNLFNNAFYAVNQKKKASGTGYKPEVSVSTSTENSHVIIKVKDNGIGMPEPIKEKIMQPFFTTKPTGEGTGLGLSLSYDIVVKGHGGKIEVETKPGVYTEFIVTLPIS